MKRHKVLFFSYWYPNRTSLVFPVFTRKHAQAIAKHCDVCVLSVSILKDPSLFRKEHEVIFDSEGVETHQIYLFSRFSKILFVLLPLQYIIIRNYYRKKLKDRQFTILHSNILFPCAINGHNLSKEMGLKHVITEHWSRLPEFFSKNIYRQGGKAAYDQAAAITCVSKILQEEVLKHTKNQKVFIVPNVVDSKDYFYAPNPGAKLRFVAAANWTEPKNPFLFMEALKRIALAGNFPEFELCLIGNGHQMESIRNKKWPFDVFFPGILDAKALNKELNSAHYFLHGSNFETFSTIIVEALMVGLPSVVSRVGIAEEVIHLGNGLIAENTIEDFENKIRSLLQIEFDRAAIATEIRDKYNSTQIGNMMLAIYNQI